MRIGRGRSRVLSATVARPLAQHEDAGKAAGGTVQGVIGELRRGARESREVDLEGGNESAARARVATQHRRPQASVPGMPSSSTNSDSARIRLDLSTSDYTAELAEAPIHRKKSRHARFAYEDRLAHREEKIRVYAPTSAASAITPPKCSPANAGRLPRRWSGSSFSTCAPSVGWHDTIGQVLQEYTL